MSESETSSLLRRDAFEHAANRGADDLKSIHQGGYLRSCRLERFQERLDPGDRVRAKRLDRRYDELMDRNEFDDAASMPVRLLHLRLELPGKEASLWKATSDLIEHLEDASVEAQIAKTDEAIEPMPRCLRTHN